MKITLLKNQVAILKEESGEIVGAFQSTYDAKQVLEQAVAEHFDVAVVGLNTDRDFDAPLDYEQPYEFVLFKSSGEDEYVTLIMTYAAIYNTDENEKQLPSQNKMAMGGMTASFSYSVGGL